MKKLITLTLMALVALFTEVQAQRTLNLDTESWESNPVSPTATKILTPTQNGYEVTYQFHKALVMPDEIIPETEVWYLDGFILNNVPGEPAYPYASDSFSIPMGNTAEVNILEEDWYTVDCQVASGHAPRLLSDTTKLTAANIPSLKIKQGWFPTVTASNNGISTYKDIDIINIGVTPVQFDTYQGKARICRTLKYEVVFSEYSPISQGRAISNDDVRAQLEEYADDPYLSVTTLNWSLERNKAEGQIKASTSVSVLTPDSAPVYLIITTSTYGNVIKEFANWKRTLGFNVVVSIANSWTPQSIKNEITRVKSLHMKLSYLLIVGNNSQVPAESVSTFVRPVTTDLLYALTAKRKVDLNYDFIPDIKYGRIPVNNISEAAIVFSKIINYEKNAPSSENSFYSSPLFLSKFLDNDIIKDGQADMRNCQTSYEIADQLAGLGLDPTIEFLAGANETPLRWGDPGLMENEDGTTSVVKYPDIPAELRKPVYKWDVTVPRIKSHLNNGTSQLYYFAHGNKSGWENMLNVSGLTGIQNGSKLPVAFSMACSTGDFTEPGCFAEKMLTLRDGGVAAMYAFTEGTFVAYTDVLAASLYNGMYPEMDYKPFINSGGSVIQPSFDNNITITELGALDCLAKTKVAKAFPNNPTNNRYKEYEISMLTLFGDPSMNIYLTKPNAVKANVAINNNKLYVATDNDATVTFYNRATGEVANHKGNITGVDLPANYDDYTICIHKPGCLPYFKDLIKINKKPATISENKIVREDRIWTYYQDWSCNMEPSENILMNVKFSGTTDINGKTYHNCYAWKAGKEFSEDESPIIAYMREEDNRVYAYYHFLDDPDMRANLIEKYGIDIMPDCPANYGIDCETNCERMIFDFNLNKGDQMWFNHTEINSESAFMTVEDIFDTEYEGKTYMTQKYNGMMSGYLAFDGVGAEMGLLPFPGATSIDYGHTPFYLTRLTDTNMTTLFELPGISGIDISEIDTRVVETQYHDLQGRRMMKPASGVYIRTYIFENGSRKVTKVLVK